MPVTQTDRHSLAARLKETARSLGFDLVGIGPAIPSQYRDYLRQWLDDGQAGTMDYLHRRFDERTNPAVYLPGAKSVICLAVNYHAPLEKIAEIDQPFHGKVARYALGDDYHELLKPRLHQLADWIKAQAPEAQTRCAVDTAPVLEKELSARAGVGWIGKNTCLINAQIGSWLLLGEVVTTLELPVDDPGIDRCGTCRRCIDACPTQAITAAYQLDARRCISYLTIEHREAIDDPLQPLMGQWVYGCDICQDVCPWNHKAPFSIEPALQSRLPAGTLDVRQVLDWTDEDYRANLQNSAIKRVKLPVLQRNAGIVRKNQSGG